MFFRPDYSIPFLFFLKKHENHRHLVPVILLFLKKKSFIFIFIFHSVINRVTPIRMIRNDKEQLAEVIIPYSLFLLHSVV